MKKIIGVALLISFAITGFAQEAGKSKKEERKRQKRERMNEIMKMEEEGVPSFNKQNAFGIKLNTDGWGLSYEIGRANTVRRATIYQIEFNEKKHPKEEKTSYQNSAGGFIFFGNPFVFGKKNNFYQLKLSGGQQLLIGGKGNKNGVSVYGIGAGGLSLGFLRPYYVEVIDNNNQNKFVKYESQDSVYFMDPASIIGGGGLARGWGEMKLAPGLHAKTAIRFDYNRFNTVISAIEGGLNAEYYFKGIDQMVYNPSRKFFINAYVSILFGKRK
ncbi:MAG: hypothetical protein ACTHLE_10245 [Agriterribacter sp.]